MQEGVCLSKYNMTTIFTGTCSYQVSLNIKSKLLNSKGPVENGLKKYAPNHSVYMCSYLLFEQVYACLFHDSYDAKRT